MAKAKQPVSVNGIEFDALMNEDLTREANVPEYPVEKGFVVSDAIIENAEQLNMVLFLTPTPVTWHSRHGGGESRVALVCKQLEELYFKKEPVTVVTSEAVYTNMAITSLVIHKTPENGYAKEIPISFKKIRVTEAKTTTIPDSYGKSGKTGASAGSANTSKGTGGNGTSENGLAAASSGSATGNDNAAQGSKASTLYNLSKKAGLLG